MILKGSQRGSGQNLAAHLTRLDENDHVLIHELRGFAVDDLAGALKEAEAISRATKCQQYLFSLSINPPQDVSVSSEAFESAINRAEERLGLQGQPRAIVFHEKNARLHAHCVWSRIDADTMTARHMSFFKQKLTGLSRELYLEHGWEMPRGLIESAKRDPNNFSLAEWQQAKRLGADPRWLKEIVRDCWARSDSKAGFERALAEHALFLCKGDRRGFVLMDHAGEVHSLSRVLGLRQKELGARLGDPVALKSIDEAKADLAKRMTPAIRRHVEDRRIAFAKGAKALEQRRVDMVLRQRNERASMAAKQKIELDSATRDRAARLPKGLRGLWHRITGKYQEAVRAHTREAQIQRATQAMERAQLVGHQRIERRALQTTIRSSRMEQAAHLREIRREVGRFLALSRGHEQRRHSPRALTPSPLKLQR